MKRFILFYSFFTFCLLMVEANPISKAQALQEAKEFLSSKGIVIQTTDEAYKAPRKANSKDSNPYYYIYNVGNDNGFVIVSGDDRTEKILGYVDSGNFDVENVPAPFKEWLRGYEREIESLSAIELSSTSPKRKAIEKTKKAIPPMTTSKWASGYPYYASTPMFDDTNAPVGCGPVCLAQFLHYYRDYVNSITSTIPSYTANNVTVSEVPAGTIIDWNNIIDEYSFNSNYNEAQIKAVADLMLYVGKSTSTIFYSYTALTATSKYCPALINYFGFDNSIAYIDREYYSVEDWENKIYNELICGRPVIYNAFSTTAGHTLLVDGYDVNGLFHINWGWAGKNNGYFRLSVLDRYKQMGISSIIPQQSYTDKHSALLYAVPASMGCVNTSDYELNGKITSASSSTLACKFHNQSGMEGYYKYGVGIVNENDEVVLVKKFNNTFAYLNNTNSATRYFSLSANDFQNAELDYGTYNVVPIFQYIDHGEWKVCQHESANYAIVNYSSNGISSSLHSNLQNISASNIECIGNQIAGSEQHIKVTIENVSNQHSFYGNIYLFASTSTLMGEYVHSSKICLNNNDEVLIDIPFTPSVTGTYNIWIATDEFGENIIGYNNLTIHSETVPLLDISDVGAYVIKNYASGYIINDKRSIWGNTFAINVTGIKNNSLNTITTKLVAWLRRYDSPKSTSWNYSRWLNKGDNGYFKPIDITVHPGETINIPIIFEDVNFNSVYDIRLEYSNGPIIFDFFPFNFLPALTTWKSDGTSISVEPQEIMEIDDDVIAVDITDATAIKTLNINSNPNVLYYLGESQTIPEGLSNANVVKGSFAENITLRDSCDFFVPKTFTAKNISFSTIPSIGAISGSNVGWNTIALPFDVTSVKNTTDNKEIDWFHPNETVGKDFWVRGFEKFDKDGDIIFVDNVEQMQAYEPYLYNVPSEYWGKKRNLCGKELTFYGENATLYKDVNAGVHSSAYNLIGTTIGKTVNNAWGINAEGDAFIFNESQNVPAFHAYFVDSNQYFSSLVSPKEKPTLRIKFHDDNNATSIMAPIATDTDHVDVFNLQGVKVASLSLNKGAIDIRQLPKGVYVVAGKKIIR